MAGVADEIAARLERIEAKLDAMLEALAEEGEEPDEIVSRTLDGHERRIPAKPEGTL